MYAKADEIRVIVRPSDHIRPMRVVEIADHVRRGMIAEQTCLGPEIVRKGRMLHTADVVHGQIRIHTGVKRNPLDPMRDQRL